MPELPRTREFRMGRAKFSVVGAQRHKRRLNFFLSGGLQVLALPMIPCEVPGYKADARMRDS